ncbi:MAG: sugar ABC transporter substrate-binding protein [Spirochaetes bacterium]|nr:sugar ABC transporter substrate-binding protein [Spirochaetota bacterium]
MRKISVVLLLLVSVLMLVSCKKKDGSDGTGVKLKLVLWDINQATYVPVLLEEYKKLRPDVEIEIINIPASDYIEKVNVMLSGGDDSDIITVKDIPEYASMVTKKQLDSLDGYIKKDKYDLSAYSGVPDELRVDNVLFALPFRSDFWILYYNKEAFDKAGVDYPSNDMTWSEYEAIARKVTSGAGADKVYGSHHHTWRSTVQLGTFQDGKNTAISKDYSFMAPVYNMVTGMQKDGIIMDYASLKAGNIHYSGLFYNKQIAMLPMGTWFIGTLMSKVKEGVTDVKWGIARFPHPDGVKAGTTAGTLASLAINAKSKNKKEAWEFIKFFCGPDGAKVLAGAGSLPAIRNEDVINVLSSRDGFPKECAGALETSTVRLELPMHPKVSQIEQILNEEHELIMTDSVTVDKGLSSMTKRVNEVLSK